ncbi:MAG: phenylalanine 4-monooxygenase [Bacteroidetes bacterium HGW-Bacteroidetes-17]|jgi:phenylalanine-4-hydroxylase|nr:MAG: phenylalanine 4-monooxygenase [Bacteroidetes bacterium HGW-Bacteroidetes-17]
MLETNSVLDKLPKHLLDLIIDQPYKEYTAQDHAVWKYVMQQNIHFLKDVAHKSYLSGLEKTGVSIDHIPHMYGMNRILKEIGWAAVAVDGFIPPSAFMEFQAYNVLVIAADIRPIDQIQYTPAPDIIHEAAGHAPIIANPEYAEYLKKFGFYGSKAFSSSKDQKMYEAVRHLSILKADPYSGKDDIVAAEYDISEIESTLSARSELAKIRNLHWWTVEYGLIGSMYFPKIYGAGLLSSIGESYHAMRDHVLKLPYSIDAMNYNFDITSMQPQLFVTPSFDYLTKVLEEFVDTMAIRSGGIDGIRKAINSENIACCVLDSGIQISGKIVDFIEENKEIAYLKTLGPSSLAFQDQELESHSKAYHHDGYGTPIGTILGLNPGFITWNDYQLEDADIKLNEHCNLEWTSGIKLKGKLKNILRKEGKIIVLSFEPCTIYYKTEILFQPDWGTFDLAIGKKVSSVYNGPADPNAYGYTFEVPKEKTHKIEHSKEAKSLHQLYQTTRNAREGALNETHKEIKALFKALKERHSKEWLLGLELVELAIKSNSEPRLIDEIKTYLSSLIKQYPEFDKLINDGLNLIEKQNN